MISEDGRRLDGTSRKRVRFSEDVIDRDPAAAGAAVATVLSSVDDDEDELGAELQATGRSLQGTEATLDAEGLDFSLPEVATALRAQHRKELDGLHLAQASIHDDVAAAEAAYDEPDELWTEDGIPIEPFHLKREREQGYFDADGTYIEFALKDDDDAWLASLAESAAGEVLPDRPASATLPEDDAADQAEQESQMRACRARMVELLQPGETVLDALRRLAVQPSSEASQSQQPNDEPAAMALDSPGTPAGNKDKLKARVRHTVPAIHRDAFNELTDCSTRLLDHGDYNAHSNTREQLQSDLRKQEQGDDIDMFALGESGRAPPTPPRQPAQHGAPEGQAGDAATADPPAVAADVPRSVQPPGPQGVAISSSPSRAGNDAHEPVLSGEPGDKISVQGVQGPNGSTLQFDQKTGMYYMPDMGCWWDGKNLYGDASSGQWFSFQDGQYQLVS